MWLIYSDMLPPLLKAEEVFTSYFITTHLLDPLMFHSSFKYKFKLVISLHLLWKTLEIITWIIELFDKLNNYMYFVYII